MTASPSASEPRRPSTARFSRPSFTFPVKLSRWREFWRTPVPVLVAAGAEGEVMVARTRLALTLVVLVLPALGVVLHPGARDVTVGLVAAGLGVVAAAFAYRLGRIRVYQPWMGFTTSLLDVTLVSAVLATFLLLQQPLTGTSSRLAFLVYFVAIAASALRFDARVCAVTAAAAVTQYLAIVVAAAVADASGALGWSDEASRLGVLALAGMVSTALVLRTRELQWLSARDKLTGLLNRGIFDDLLLDASLRARRYGRPLSIMMVDVDQFKGFNDSWGHAAGDEALKAVAAAIKQSVRQGEIVARYGGDEFVVLFPETVPETAVSRGEKIRQRVPPIVAGGRGRQQTVPVTISIGVASLPADGADAFDVLNQADARLYEAKHAGRNAVVGPASLTARPAQASEGR
jgi:diguanylate cyclase (GGDEF)-like protein